MRRDETRRADLLKRCVALALIELEPGDRVPTIRDLATRCGASVGATQMALSRLESEQSIALERRGRYGTFLRERSLGGMWNATQGRPLVLSLPLPSTVRIQGLATAVKAAVAAAGIDVFLIFVRGSRQRMVAVRREQCDVAVMSSLAAQQLAGGDTQLVVELEPESFVREHRVYYAPGRSDRVPLRVGIDTDSFDFQWLTEHEFADMGVEYVPGPYMHSVALMRERRLDAALGDVEEAFAPFPRTVRDRPLSDSVRAVVGTRNTSAAFVCRTDDVAARTILTHVLDAEEVAQVQGEVLAGQRVPEY